MHTILILGLSQLHDNYIETQILSNKSRFSWFHRANLLAPWCTIVFLMPNITNQLYAHQSSLLTSVSSIFVFQVIMGINVFAFKSSTISVYTFPFRFKNPNTIVFIPAPLHLFHRTLVGQKYDSSLAIVPDQTLEFSFSWCSNIHLRI